MPINTPAIAAILVFAASLTATAEDNGNLIAPKSVRKVVSDGRHNAFAAFTRWRDRYWLAFRQGTGHVSRDGDMIVLESADTKSWTLRLRLDVIADDRDAQFLITDDRLILYTNGLEEGAFSTSATSSADGRQWTDAVPIYDPGFFIWKPVKHGDRYYAGCHRPGSIQDRESHLVTSTDGLHWTKVSTIRAGMGESETTLQFQPDGQITAFLRSQVTVGGHILESKPPYRSWRQRPAGIHLSGHTIYRFDKTSYLIGRWLGYDPPVEPSATRASVADRHLDQATMVYVVDGKSFTPYCQLGELDGNRDSSYAEAVRNGDDMLIVYHRAAHEFVGEFRAKDAADLYLARVPLRR